MLTSKPVFSLVNERLSLGIMNGPDKIQCIVFFSLFFFCGALASTETRNCGTPEFWNAKTLEHWKTKTPERHRNTGMPER